MGELREQNNRVKRLVKAAEFHGCRYAKSFLQAARLPVLYAFGRVLRNIEGYCRQPVLCIGARRMARRRLKLRV